MTSLKSPDSKIIGPLAATLGLLLLAGCGGGGGGGGGLPTPDPLAPKQPASNFVDEEFLYNYGLNMIGAQHAYAEGAYGSGVVVAVIDSGIDTEHYDLDDNISPQSTDIVVPGTPLADELAHGTMVAGIIAAERNDFVLQGVAFDATILAIRTDARYPDGTSKEYFLISDIAAGIDYAAGKAHVINISLGMSGSSGDGSLGTDFEQALIDAMAEDAIIVAAAGNDRALEPVLPAAYAGDALVNVSGQMVAVAGANSTGDGLWTDSNQCGSAMEYCLIAPAQEIWSTFPGDYVNFPDTYWYAQGDGTSFATAHVSGAAALLVQLWPTLAPAEVVDILLTSATDLGAADIDPVYGHGLLNVETALAPAGSLQIPLADAVTGPKIGLDRTLVALGPAFGDALSGSTLLGQAFALDEYDRNYMAGLDARVVQAERDFGLRALVEAGVIEPVDTVLPNGMTVALGVTDETPVAHAADWSGMAADRGPDHELHGLSLAVESEGGTAYRLGYDVTPEQHFPSLAASETAGLFWMPGDVLGPQYALVGAGTGLSVSRGLGADSGITIGLVDGSRSENEAVRNARIGEVAVEHRFAGGAVVSAGFSMVDENGGFLGSDAAGGFAVRGADTRFYTLGGSIPVGAAVELIGNYTLGRADMAADVYSLLGNWSEVSANAFGFGIVKRGIFGDSDRIGLLAGQPLRVSSGAATLTLPVDYTLDKTVTQASERISLAPSGREIDLQFAYDADLGESGLMSAWFMMQREPGHVAAADPAYGVGLQFSTEF